MPFPPWTRELLSGSLDDVAKKLQNLETVRELQSRASTLLGDLPIAAARGLDRILQETRKGTDHLRRWVKRQTTLNLSAINASGVYFHSLVEGSPLHQDAAEKMLRSGEYFSLAGGSASERIEHRLASAIENQVNCTALFASSVPAALFAVAASVSGDDSLIVPRAFSVRLQDGVLIPNLLASSGRRIVEIGSSDSCLDADWNSATRFSSQSGSSLGASPQGPLAFTIQWPASSQQSSSSQPARPQVAAPPNQFRSVQYIPYGVFPQTSPFPQGHDFSTQTNVVNKSIIEANWLTIVPTHLLLGGPMGALILGSEAALESISGLPLWSALQASLHDKAALAIALESGSLEAHPKASLRTLLSVSVENLQNRAERLATQLAGETSFQSCRITQEPARLAHDLPATIPSRQLVVRPGGNSQRLHQRLLADAPALVTEATGEDLIIDFRWIPSHLDAGLVSLLTEKPEPDSQTNAVNPPVADRPVHATECDLPESD